MQVSIDQDEIQVATRAFLGYLGDAERDQHLPFATGDLGQLTPAGIHLAGRRKHLLITSFVQCVAGVESVLLAQPSPKRWSPARHNRALRVAILPIYSFVL